MDIQLVNYMRNQVEQVPTYFKRFMMGDIDWNGRMFGLVGPRGTGKTTLFLQYIKEHEHQKKMFYASGDNLYFSSHSLVELADEFSREDGDQLFIDEIHKYRNWSRELKQIYDTHPDLQVAFTGSSILDITQGEADLSRRAPIYHLQGLSFREYLGVFEQIEAPLLSLEEIIAGKAFIDGVRHPLPFFKQYLLRGYYPYAQDSLFDMELTQVVNQTLEVDIPTFAKMNASTGRKLKHLLMIIAQSVPFKPVMDKLATMIGVSRNYMADYLMYLEKAGMIASLRDTTSGLRALGKVAKIYLDNTNLANLLGGNATNVGNLRETFFLNQMRVRNNVVASRISDFEIDGYTFEVGGQKKNARQLADAQQGFVVRDDIEFGTGNVIPLWAFGLNY